MSLDHDYVKILIINNKMHLSSKGIHVNEILFNSVNCCHEENIGTISDLNAHAYNIFIDNCVSVCKTAHYNLIE